MEEVKKDVVGGIDEDAKIEEGLRGAVRKEESFRFSSIIEGKNILTSYTIKTKLLESTYGKILLFNILNTIIMAPK